MSSTRPTFTESDFHKATFSQPNQSCVEVAQQSGWAEVRDSKTAFGAANDHRLVLTGLEATTFLSVVKTGRLDR
ncbi:MAG: DUF397 domain-containing protein [Actinophytocola sp.]|uniref:DUF397 domain-containing protein n=1 Tax=Actinophytocola sp. TaxID=1872138 RepID=UPI0013251B0D|nr:DUF397 domain-containing protein [Actinophytocola sp.]MPZ84309.1 DUF397 domain-containing protein [Actinophytocola sp.]